MNGLLRMWTPTTTYTATLLIVLVVLGNCAVSAEPATSVEVDISGINGPALENVLKLLSIEQQKARSELTRAQLLSLHRLADEEIRRALEPFGYYHPTIAATLDKQNGRWIATYAIDPGTPVALDHVDVHVLGQGADDPMLQGLVAEFPLHAGDILVQGEYTNAKAQLQRTAAERGYLDAVFVRHEIRVQPSANTAQIELLLETGRRYRFGSVTFDQEAFDPEFLARFVNFKSGDFYSLPALWDLENALTDSDYFAQVIIQPHLAEAIDFHVPIVATLTPRNKHKYTAGLGYGTDTGPRVALGWQNRRINRNGHRLSTELQASAVKDSAKTSYKIPLARPRTDWLEFSAGWQKETADTSDSETSALGVSQTKALGRRWLQTLYLNYEFESYRVGTDLNDTELLFPGITWLYVKADDRIYTRSGRRLLLDVKGTDWQSLRFLQLRTQGKVIEDIGQHGRIILRGEVGATWLGELSALPASLRFFTGGDQSVRGYPYKSLGPIDSTGNITGGEQLLVGSIEYEHRLFSGRSSAAVFYDAGNALNNFSDPLKHGAGVGLRWRTPIGLLRLDLAWALSKPGSPNRVHFVMGPDL